MSALASPYNEERVVCAPMIVDEEKEELPR